MAISLGWGRTRDCTGKGGTQDSILLAERDCSAPWSKPVLSLSEGAGRKRPGICAACTAVRCAALTAPFYTNRSIERELVEHVERAVGAGREPQAPALGQGVIDLDQARGARQPLLVADVYLGGDALAQGDHGAGEAAVAARAGAAGSRSAPADADLVDAERTRHAPL